MEALRENSEGVVGADAAVDGRIEMKAEIADETEISIFAIATGTREVESATATGIQGIGVNLGHVALPSAAQDHQHETSEIESEMDLVSTPTGLDVAPEMAALLQQVLRPRIPRSA